MMLYNLGSIVMGWKFVRDVSDCNPNLFGDRGVRIVLHRNMHHWQVIVWIDMCIYGAVKIII